VKEVVRERGVGDEVTSEVLVGLVVEFGAEVVVAELGTWQAVSNPEQRHPVASGHE
jgi:hypothetical protein